MVQIKFTASNFEKYQTMSLGPKNKAKDLEITMSNVKIRCGSELRSNHRPKSGFQ